MRSWKLGLIIFIALIAGLSLGVYIRGRTLNPLAVIPTPLNRVLSAAAGEGEEQSGEILYYKADLADFVQNGSPKTKIETEGAVLESSGEPDGDRHVVIGDGKGNNLVTEFIPEIKGLSLPAKGGRIRIWGIVRFDFLHNWWELHPVIGWQKI